MNKRSIVFLSIFLATAVLIAGGVLWYANEIKKEAQMAQQQIEEEQRQMEEEQKKQEERNKKFVTDVDTDVSHWQTKETEFFTIKFPKEWYWMESDLKKSGYYSQVITNDPNFDIDKYADVGVGAGINYPLILKNDTEIVITFSGVSVTFEVGTPLESIDSQIRWMQKDVNPRSICNRVDSGIVPMAFCSFVNDDNQNVQVYFVAEKSFTYAFTARTTKASNRDMKPILERIAKSFTVNNGTSRK